MAKNKDYTLLYVLGIIILFFLLLKGCKTEEGSLIQNSGGGNSDIPSLNPVQLSTCQLTAQQNGYYYKEGITIVNNGLLDSCYGYSSQDCIEKGLVMKDFGLTPNCCLYTCELANNPVQPLQPTCIDTDGGQDDQYQVYGTCESSVTQSGSWDICVSTTRLNEQYCEEDFTCQTSYHACIDGQICYGGRCRSPPECTTITPYNPTDCDVGATTDGGVCMYWGEQNGNPAKCLSTFN